MSNPEINEEINGIDGNVLAGGAGDLGPLDNIPGSIRLRISPSELDGKIIEMKEKEPDFLTEAKARGKKVVAFAGSCGIAIMIGFGATLAGVKVIKVIYEHKKGNDENED